MFHLIVIGFLLAGLLPFCSEYQYRHTPEYLQWANVLKRPYLTVDLAVGVLFLVIAAGLLLRRRWARTLALAVLLAWLAKNVLLLLAGVLFLERLGAYSLLALLFLGKLGASVGSSPPGARDAFGAILAALAHPVASRLLILAVGGTVIFIVLRAYLYLRHDGAVGLEFGPPTVFGRRLSLRHRDLTLPILAAAYLAVPFVPAVGRLPVWRALGPEGQRTARRTTTAPDREKEIRLVDLEFGPDLDSMIVFSARQGAARVDLGTGTVRRLDPAVFSYVGAEKGAPERIRSRVTPDHRWFLNRDNELVRIADGTKRALQLQSPLGRPLVFLDPKQLVTVDDKGEFQWVELDPDRVTWTAPAFPEDVPPSAFLCAELVRKVPVIEVSAPRNALYYEVADAHYLFDLASGEVRRVAAAGRGTRLEAFSREGDIAILRVPRFEDRYQVLLLVDLGTGATTPRSWAGSPIWVSSAGDIAVTRDHTMVLGFALRTPGGALWQSALSAHDVHVTADGATLFSAVGPVSRFSWTRLDPLTGPKGEKTVSLRSVQGPGESPWLVTDPTSQLAAWCMGPRVEVFRIGRLGAGQAESRVYDLEPVFSP